MFIEPRAPERLARRLLESLCNAGILPCQKIFDRISASHTASHSVLATLVSLDLIRHIAP
jgi:hypothetical protein